MGFFGNLFEFANSLFGMFGAAKGLAASSTFPKIAIATLDPIGSTPWPIFNFGQNMLI